MLFKPSEKGDDIVEFALVLLLVVIVTLAALEFLGPTIRFDLYQIFLRLFKHL